MSGESSSTTGQAPTGAPTLQKQPSNPISISPSKAQKGLRAKADERSMFAHSAPVSRYEPPRAPVSKPLAAPPIDAVPRMDLPPSPSLFNMEEINREMLRRKQQQQTANATPSAATAATAANAANAATEAKASRMRPLSRSMADYTWSYSTSVPPESFAPSFNPVTEDRNEEDVIDPDDPAMKSQQARRIARERLRGKNKDMDDDGSDQEEKQAAIVNSSSSHEEGSTTIFNILKSGSLTATGTTPPMSMPANTPLMLGSSPPNPSMSPTDADGDGDDPVDDLQFSISLDPNEDSLLQHDDSHHNQQQRHAGTSSRAKPGYSVYR